MAQPANDPRWNTNLTNQTDPPSGQKDSGWAAASPLDSSYLNWLLYTIYLWVLYLKNLTSEALTWLALQTFTFGIIVTKAAGDAITTTAGTGAGAAGIKSNGGAGAGSTGGHFISLTSASGIGVVGQGTLYGVAGTGATFGVSGIGDTQAGVIGTSDTGVGGYFQSTNGRGLYAQGGYDADAIRALGQGTGDGIQAEGGDTGGCGVRGIGGAAGGNGGIFTGNAATGVVATGGAGAGGVQGIGGAGAWGVDAYSTGVAALRASRSDSNSLGVFDCRGAIDFENATAAAGNAAQKNKLGRKSFAKASIQFVCNNTVNPTINDRQNILTITQHATNGTLTVTFAQPMANTSYLVQALAENEPIYSAVEISTKTVNGFVMRPKGTNDNAYKTTSTLDVIIFNVIVWGDQ